VAEGLAVVVTVEAGTTEGVAVVNKPAAGSGGVVASAKSEGIDELDGDWPYAFINNKQSKLCRINRICIFTFILIKKSRCSLALDHANFSIQTDGLIVYDRIARHILFTYLFCDSCKKIIIHLSYEKKLFLLCLRQILELSPLFFLSTRKHVWQCVLLHPIMENSNIFHLVASQ